MIIHPFKSHSSQFTRPAAALPLSTTTHQLILPRSLVIIAPSSQPHPLYPPHISIHPLTPSINPLPVCLSDAQRRRRRRPRPPQQQQRRRRRCSTNITNTIPPTMPQNLLPPSSPPPNYTQLLPPLPCGTTRTRTRTLNRHNSCRKTTSSTTMKRTRT